jgi:hypothetical protein
MISEPHSRPLQTGLTSVSSRGELCAFRYILSANTPLYEVRSTGHNVPHPSTESRAGVGAAVNVACNVAAELEGSCE